MEHLKLIHENNVNLPAQVTRTVEASGAGVYTQISADLSPSVPTVIPYRELFGLVVDLLRYMRVHSVARLAIIISTVKQASSATAFIQTIVVLTMSQTMAQ